MIPLPPKRDKQKLPCPVCKHKPCYEHCNHCGKSIHFKKNEYGRWCCYEDANDTLHKCMKYGTDHKWYNKHGKKPEEVYVNYFVWFLKRNVVWERDNMLMKEAKIKQWKKLVGWDEQTTYADRLKTKENLRPQWGNWILDT